MKITDRNVVRLAVVQQIRAAHGIKIKNWNKNKTCNKFSVGSSVRVFGVPLDNLVQCNVPEYGSIPRFLVDACTNLTEHIHTEGLFRKSGSVTRLKALRAKLDQGEDCIPMALPCDVAGLLKQFFRELPDPILPTELQEALLKAQELPTTEERTSALQLLSCVLPDRNAHTLRYFFTFLRNVSQRCGENKMDSGNLSVIFTPNLLHCEGAEKMNSGTERRLKLQAAVVRFFIENPLGFGLVPSYILERIPAMVGSEAGLVSPVLDHVEDWETESGMKKRQRRSLGVFSVTPVIMTPSTKRKMPLESAQSCGFSNKKRKSIKKNLGLELLPSSLFSSSSTPSSGKGFDSSPSVSLDSSQSASVGKTRGPSAMSARRKSKHVSKHVSRVESGKAGCFSPRGAKKESARRSLRLRFSLGRSRGDPNVISHSLLGSKASETIGWRLATQESTTSFWLAKGTPCSQAVLRDKSTSKHSKQISKSEDNLLTPQCTVGGQRASWRGGSPDVPRVFSSDSFSDTPVGTCYKNGCYSGPLLVITEPPAVEEAAHCSFTRGDTMTGPMALRIKNAFGESGSGLCSLTEDGSSLSGKEPVLQAEGKSSSFMDSQQSKECCFSPTPKKSTSNYSIPLSELEMTPLTPLHIDSALFELGASSCSLDKDSVLHAEEKSCVVGELDQVKSSGSVEVLSGQSPSVSYRTEVQLPIQKSPFPAAHGTPPPVQRAKALRSPTNEACWKKFDNAPGRKEGHRSRVAEHIQRFNTLTLNSPMTKIVRSPLRFQRTPVRQSVRRINSLLGDTKSIQLPESPVIKSISLDSGLSVTEQQASSPHKDKRAKQPPKVAPRRPSSIRQQANSCALNDVTNKVQQKAKCEPCLTLKTDGTSNPANPEKVTLHPTYEKDKCCYRGSPRNPLSESRLLSTTKPIDL